MILDADLTTIPEELPYFVDVIASGQAEFVNGSRLVYPVPKGAMNTANMLGNKFFSVAFTYLLGQRVKDTLAYESPLEKRLGADQSNAGELGDRRPLGRL